MAKRLIWSENSIQELNSILSFWNENNQSTSYSSKLLKRILFVLELVCENNYLGKPTSKQNVRLTIIDNFLVYYEIMEEDIFVLTIFDGRRNPKDKSLK